MQRLVQNVGEQTQWWDPPRRRRVAEALLIGLFVALIAFAQRPAVQNSALFRGDFPGFYAPAEIIASGQGARLYDPELQRQIENTAWPEMGGSFLMSVYPAPVGVVLAPLAFMPVVVARVVFSCLMLICWIFVVRALARINPSWTDQKLVLGIWWLAALPLFIAIFGGQNSSLSALLFILISERLSQRNARADLIAGMLAGALCYKPQLGLLVIFYLVCSLRWRVVGGAGVILALGYLLGALGAGWDWPSSWLAALAKFGPQNLVTNGYQMTSIWALIEALGGGRNLAIFATLGAGIAFGVCVWRTRELAGAQLINQLAWAAPAILLISPQSLFYDLTLALVGFAMVFRVREDRQVWCWWGLVGLVNAAVLFKEQVAFPLAAVCALICLVLISYSAPGRSTRAVPD